VYSLPCQERKEKPTIKIHVRKIKKYLWAKPTQMSTSGSYEMSSMSPLRKKVK